MKIPPEFSTEERHASRWLERMAEGQASGLDALYALYHRPLLSFLLSIVQDSGAAEEILQDTFIRAFRSASRFDPQLGTPFSWLATIGKRQAIDWLRRQRCRPEIVGHQTEQPGGFADKSLLDDTTRLHNHIEHTWLREAMGGLAPGQREVIELAFFEGFTHVEIAEALNRPLGTVKSDLRRGLLELKKQVSGKP